MMRLLLPVDGAAVLAGWQVKGTENIAEQK
jgi:hypothetical protein